jgi:NAD(P)-dependent dehydrogenase (short-subunit alcohol dehydrogenase family)
MPTALITGASRGLGRALALRLADDGWTLLVDARENEPLQRLTEELAARTTVRAIAGDVGDETHRVALAKAAANFGGLDAVVHNASTLGPSPQPQLADYPLDALRQVYEINVFAPLRLTQLLDAHLRDGASVAVITSDAAVEHYAGWGGYGSSKAALEHVFGILAEERPDLRVYRVDPGDMRTRMHQEAFPGEDISDRPLPDVSVPGLVALLSGDHRSGRYHAREVKGEGERQRAGGRGSG